MAPLPAPVTPRSAATAAPRVPIKESTAIYIAIAVSTFVVFYAGVTGAQGAWFWTALGLLGIEVTVFAGSGMACPLTALAIKYGATTGHVSGRVFSGDLCLRFRSSRGQRDQVIQADMSSFPVLRLPTWPV
jgi:hypothetical protein